MRHRDDDDELVTTAELAVEFHVSRRTVERWIASGDLRAHRVGRVLWVRRRDVRRFLRRHALDGD